MPKLRLSFISAFNERVDPLMKGVVQAEGVEIVPTYSHPSETFWRQLKFQEFEVGDDKIATGEPRLDLQAVDQLSVLRILARQIEAADRL